MQNLITQHLDIWTNAHKTRSTAGRGSNIKLELVGIKKLRELILELAVRGKLVPQDPNDEPASELLKKIAVEKAKLIKEGKIKKEKPLPEITDEEKPFELPSGWEWVRLKEITSKITDGDHQTPPRIEIGLRLLSAKNVRDGFLDFESCDYIAEEAYLKSRERCLPEPGDLLIVSVGGTIGRSSVVPSDSDFALVRSVALIKPLLIYSEFLKRSMDSRLLQDSIHSRKRGGAQPCLYLSEISMFPFVLPPLPEQHRIVAKVDELMAFCDQLEKTQSDNIAAHAQLVEALLATLTNSSDHNELQNNWQRIATHFDTLFTTEHSIDQLKQTILQLAVMGKLVPQNPNDEPASELLKKIAAEKALLIKEGKIKKEKPLPEITDEEKPFELPSGWEFVRLNRFSILKGGFAYQSSKFSESGVHQVIRMGNIRPDFLRIDEKPVFITDEYASTTADYKLEVNDILLTMTGTKNKRDYLYSVAIDNEHLASRQLYLNQRLCAIKALHIDTRFLSLCLKNETLLDAIFAKSTGTANQANIGMEAISSWVIPIAPLEEQHRIVAKVDELMTLCDTLKTNLQNAQTTQLALADALVEQAVG